MQELRLVAVSEDGSYAVLTAPGRSGRFSLPIDERLRIVARGQFARLAQYEIEVESPLRPKEIQDRIRAWISLGRKGLSTSISYWASREVWPSATALSRSSIGKV